ncbi:hypothetical protein [Frateuria sp.]|uniref:hypothetical protein n=1 Tax=Frateuria sp. TaxID=2211372 RepID=UPI0017A75EC2|nr:hypothetical protein [Frateuria sp.]NUR22296.1 hypothetical protein [Frateuria sp.]
MLAEQAFARLPGVRPDDVEALQFLASCQLDRRNVACAIEWLPAADLITAIGDFNRSAPRP